MTAANTPFKLDHLQLDEHQRLMQTVPCAGCDYNLRGLPVEDRCPECNLELVRSLAPNRLALSDANWLATMARDCDVILRGLILGAVIFVILVVSSWWLENHYGAPGLWTEMLAWALAMPPGLVIAFGCRRLCTPEPGRSNFIDSPYAWTTRLCIGATVVMALLTAPAHLIDPYEPVFSAATIALGCLAVMIGGFAAMMLARTLAKRIPMPSLAYNMKLLLIGYFVLTVMVMAIVGLLMIFGGVDFDPVNNFLEMVQIISLLLTAGLIVASILLSAGLSLYTLTMLFWFRMVLARLARGAGS